MKKKSSLFIQDAPEHSLKTAKSHRQKKRGKKIVFKTVFKLLEGLLVIVEIIREISEILKP